MALSVSLVCDVCGRSVEPVVCTNLAPRGAIKAAKVAPRWRRIRSGPYAGTQDVCPACMVKIPKPRREPRAVALARRYRDAGRSVHANVEGVVIAFRPKGEGGGP